MHLQGVGRTGGASGPEQEGQRGTLPPHLQGTNRTAVLRIRSIFSDPVFKIRIRMRIRVTQKRLDPDPDQICF